MGCAASTKEQSERSGLGQLEAKRRCEMGEQSGRMSMSLHEGIVYDPDELIKRLEKLDEERHFIQQQLNRAHNAVELADTSISEEVDVPANRSRFSRVAPANSSIRFPTIRAIPESRGFSSSTSRAAYDRRASGLATSSFGPRLSHASYTSNGTGITQASPNSPSQLLAMVRRGRKRAQYNSRRQTATLTVMHENENVLLLPRGGVYVKTRHGPVQFGIPPETIKDTLRLGVDVPKMYVVGKERFNLKFGTNTAEFEFPAYYNFFIKGSRTTVVSSAEAASVIRSVMDEAIEGPVEDELYQDSEYSPFVEPSIYEARPDLHAEIGYFKEPRNGRKIETDTLLAFVKFEPSAELEGQMVASMAFEDGSVSIHDRGDVYDVLVDGELVASVPDWLASAIADPPHILMPSRSLASISSMDDFETPEFGVTILGAADGFTPTGTTAGFVLWMRGHGILVDPPAHSAHYLRLNGISSRKITHVILTHCHADHDAGTFQKILLEQRVTVMTTRTIMAAFIRKYALISDMPIDFLQRLFLFHSVKIAEPVHFQGGSIKFFYSLHALPCIGFRAELAGKSITYSGDTFYDPDGLIELEKRGIISEARRLSLLHDCSVQESDLLMHEAGVPPIHTPMSALQQLPERIRSKVKVIHCSDARAEEGGFEKVRPGFEHTIRIEAEPPLHAEANSIVQILMATDLFRSFDVASMVDVLSVITTRSYAAKEVICSSGEEGAYLRIIRSGTVNYERDGATRELRYCDYFGEVRDCVPPKPYFHRHDSRPLRSHRRHS
mmetsp:Transcript_4316/g.11996  ORF Transcript_4316/g.11996 Transcript_4316/m.11996 type:complete len:782 (+) Transcript_4316:202-2547(+)